MTQAGRISDRKALLIGWVWVSTPVMCLLFGPLAALFLVHPDPDHLSFPTLLIAFGVGAAAAWTWWSIMLPRWRLWSYARVENPLALKHKSVEAQLAWRDESWFTRTEIKSREHARRERDYERKARERFGSYQPSRSAEPTMDEQAKAFLLVTVPLMFVLVALVANSRLAGEEIEPKHNAGLIVFGLMMIAMPYGYRWLDVRFVGRHRYLPTASITVGLLAFVVVDYSSLTAAISVGLLPIILLLAGRALTAYLVRK